MSITKLHTPLTKITLAILTAVSSLSLSSCQDEDYGFTTDEVRASVYARNFEKTYGKISKDQIWDFSSYNLHRLGLTGGASVDAVSRFTGGTRANSLISQNLAGDYEISSTTTKWLNEHMTEKQPHQDQVMSFSLQASDVFYILPIYQGQSGMLWDLKLEDETSSYTIWHKSDGFKFTTDYTMWEEYHYESGVNTFRMNDKNHSALRFDAIFSDLPNNSVIESKKSDNNYKVSLTIAAPAGQTTKGKFALFYEDGGQTKYYYLTGTDFEISTNTINKDNCASDGLFSFDYTNNSKIEDGHLSYTGGSGNQVDLKPLVGKTFTGDNSISVSLNNQFSNLVFVIDPDSYNSDYRFYTWSGNRIRVFAKYMVQGSEENMTHDKAEAYMKAHTISRNHLKTQLIKIDNEKINGVFNFNLETTDLSDGDKGLSTIGEAHRSNDIPGMIRAITAFSPGSDVIDAEMLREKLNKIIGDNKVGGYDELPSDFKYMVLGCEDARGGGYDQDGRLAVTDWDYNDVVFLLVGKTLPTIYEGTVEKRYMIEDLGSTFDFDFNDIVVDVKEEHTRNLSDPYKYNFKQTATIKFLCGTIPFQIFLGEKQFGTGPMLGHNGSDEKGYYPTEGAYTWTFRADNVEISDVTKEILEASYASVRSTNNIWDPKTNNIKVLVWPKAGTNGKGTDIYWNGTGSAADNISNGKPVNIDDIPLEHNTVLFPKEGEYPYIIATDPTVQWMPELHSIPEYWLQTKPVTNWGVNYDGPNGWQEPSSPQINVTLGVPIPTFTFQSGNNWDYNARISKDQFSDIAVGDKIVLTISNVVGSSATVALSVPNNNWSYKVGTDPSKDGDSGYFGLTSGQTTLAIEIKNDEDITQLKNYGIAIQGHDFTLHQVDVVKPVVIDPVRPVDVPAALGAPVNYTVTPKSDNSFQRIYLTNSLINYNGYDDILVTVANPSSEANISAQVIGTAASGTQTITMGNYYTYELKDQAYKTAYSSGNLFLETYAGSNLFTRTDGQKAQIYVTTRTVVKDVNVPAELGKEFEYYHTPAGQGGAGDYPRVYLADALKGIDYNGYDDILVTIANRSNTSMKAVVAGGPANTGEQTIPSGGYYTFTLSAEEYKRTEYLHLDATQNGDKLNRSIADAAKIYVTSQTAAEFNFTAKEVFGTDAWWEAAEGENKNYTSMFSGGLKVSPDEYVLRVCYSGTDSEIYDFCQSNGNNWWEGGLTATVHDSTNKYLQLTLTQEIIDNLNNSRPLYINTDKDGHRDMKVISVKLLKKL